MPLITNRAEWRLYGVQRPRCASCPAIEVPRTAAASIKVLDASVSL
jgi:hypothetical protein